MKISPVRHHAPTAIARPRPAAASEPADDYQASAPGSVLQGKQFADSHGRVTHLALMLSDSYATRGMRRQILDAYKTLFTEMEPDTRFTVVVESNRDKADVEALASQASNPERIQILKPDVGRLTVWARDMMVPEFIPGDAAHTMLVQQTPLHNWHDNDSAVPPAIAEANPRVLLDVAPQLVTDGGEVMANTRESFVGYYSVAATAKQLEKAVTSVAGLQARLAAEYEERTGNHVLDPQGKAIFPFEFVPQAELGHRLPYQLKNLEVPRLEGGVSLAQMYEDEAVSLFQTQFGKPVTVMGKDDPNTRHVEEPATDHLDMGLTPIDDHTFFVGDPGLATRLLAEMTPAERQQAEAKLEQQLGYPVSLAQDSVENRDNPEDFDNYVRIVEKKGYKVVRLPHAEAGRVGSPYVSYNNCLMERFEKDGHEVRRVFLPVYGIDKLDDYAIKTWQEQGFEVHPMPLGVLSTRWGALRCISNWLDRGPQP
ncbi:MAG: hypothetical protein AB7S38_41750 [Vulcanimicrobiota bacterium]